jgi:hypothetical protein
MAILLQNKHEQESHHHQQQPLCVTNTHGHCFPHDCNKTQRLCVLMTQLEPQQLNITQDTRICNLNSKMTSKKSHMACKDSAMYSMPTDGSFAQENTAHCSCWYLVDSSGEQTAATPKRKRCKQV